MRRGRHGVDRTAARAWAAAALLAFVAGGAWGAAPACDDCKYLPCVQSELTHYKDMQKMYLDLARKAEALARKGEAMEMKDFSKLADEQTDKLLDRHKDRIKGKPACENRYPEGLFEGDYVAKSKWNSFGFGLEKLDDGRHRVDISAVTDPERCELRERRLNGLMEVLACAELAIATRKHEEKHVADCRKAKPKTPEDYARFEAAGYAEGIKELEKTAKRIKDKKCPKPQPTPKQGPKAQEAMKRTLGAAGERLAMYAKAKGY